MDTLNREPAGRLRRLSDLSDYDVADDRPDVRGWKIDDAAGHTLGKVDDLVVDTGTMTVQYLELKLDRKPLNLDRDKHAIVPVQHAHLDRDNKRIHVPGLTGATAATLPEFTGGDQDRYSGAGWDKWAGGRQPEQSQRLTRAEEELRIGKRQREGEIRAVKHVETERVREDVPVRREEPFVERRPVSGREGREMRGAGIGDDDEIRMPIVEEEAVVEKRPVVKEELVVGKQVRDDTQRVETDVRRERIDVDEKGKGRVEERDPNFRNR